MIFYLIIFSPIFFLYAYGEGFKFFSLTTWFCYIIAFIIGIILQKLINMIVSVANDAYLKNSNFKPADAENTTSILFTGVAYIASIKLIKYLIGIGLI